MFLCSNGASRLRSIFLVSAAVSAIMAAASPAYANPAASAPAPEASAMPVGEIVVTATRRETSLQSTPLALSALDSANLRRNNITDLTKLPLQVPSLYVGGNDGFGGSTVAVRGIGSLSIGVGGEEGVGVYIDGVYQGKPYGNVFDFVDIDRVEVMRGPQGTLYGRNATGGAINVVTKQPGNEFTGQIDAGYTNYQGVHVSGYALVPLIQDKLSLKVAVSSESRDGWAYNTTRNEKVYGIDNKYASASLRWHPTENTDIVFGGRAGKNYTGSQEKDVNQNTANNLYTNDGEGALRNRYISGWLSITQDLDKVQMVSITGGGSSKALAALDTDFGPQSLIYGISHQKSRQFSEEIRLVSQTDGPFSWIVGGLYYHEKSSVFLPLQLFGSVVLFDAALRTNSYSGYAEGTYKLTSKLSVTVGARYSYDAKHWLGCAGGFGCIAPSLAPGNNQLPTSSAAADAARVPDSRNYGSLTPHAVVDYQLTDHVFLYASATRGFRSGGWNFTDATSFHSGFTPENIWSYEGGAKMALFDRRLRFNLAGFYADYSKVQVRVTDPVFGFLATRNAGAARIYGVELETSYKPDDRLAVSFNGGYLNAEYTTFNSGGVNYAGNSLSRSPRFQGTAAAQYVVPLPKGLGMLTPRAEYHYTSEVFYTPDNIQPLGAGPTNIVNLRIKYEPEGQHWNVTAYVDNLTNDIYRTFATPGILPNTIAGTYSTPRIYGLQAQYNW